MGAVAARLANRVVVTSDNPRLEDPRAIIDAILAGVPSGHRDRCSVEPDRRAAIEAAIAELVPGDVLVIAGKGHEDYQILPDGKGGTRTIEFDDRRVAREAIWRRRRGAAGPERPPHGRGQGGGGTA
jgi:UDP-N-acetylmuramoyl-L-alanyl-D-glutamate--2,6-diaminopimelate ligase